MGSKREEVCGGSGGWKRSWERVDEINNRTFVCVCVRYARWVVGLVNNEMTSMGLADKLVHARDDRRDLCALRVHSSCTYAEKT